jgi:predicted flap endonuclease-1-like 5' DNA nuclease
VVNKTVTREMDLISEMADVKKNNIIKFVPVLKETYVDKPVYKENIIEEEVIVVRNVIQEKIVEKPVYRDVIIEREVFQERIVEKPVYRDVIIEREIVQERIVEKPIYKEVIVEREVIHEVMVEKPIIREVIVEREVVQEVIVEKPVIREVIIEREVITERIVEKLVPREVVVEREVFVDTIVEKIVEKPIRRQERIDPEFEEKATARINYVDTLSLESHDLVADNRTDAVQNGKRDDLKIVEGIGSKIEEVLHGAGVYTFEQLASMSAEEIRQILENAGPRFSFHDPSTWAEQSSLAYKGEWEELETLKKVLNKGKRG